MIQDVLLVIGKRAAFVFAHAESLGKWKENVPQNLLTV